MPRAREFRVIVATDGSTHAARALTLATRFPWPDRARVRAVVARRIDAALGGSVLLAALGRSAELVARRAKRRLLPYFPGADALVVDSTPVKGVLREAQRFSADAIVLGWRGHGPVRRLLLGSVSRRVIRRARCAVLVVRRSPSEVRRIVVGVDGSVHARRAIAFVSRLKAPPDGRVVLVRAVERLTLPANALTPPGIRHTVVARVERLNRARIAAAREALMRDAARLARRGWRVSTEVTTGAPLRDVLDTAARTKSHVVVVGARGVSGVSRLLLGSVAEGVLNRCPVPVLVVR